MRKMPDDTRSYLVDLFDRMASEPTMSGLRAELESASAALKSGATVDTVSDALFDELFRRSSPGRIADLQILRKTPPEWEGPGTDAKRKALTHETSALYDLQWHGLRPSPHQKERMLARLAEADAMHSAKPPSAAEAHVALEYYSLVKKAVIMSAWAYDSRECSAALGNLRCSGDKLDFAESYAEDGILTRDIAPVLGKALSDVMGDRHANPQDRVKAHALSGRISEGLKTAARHPEAQPREPGKKIPSGR